MFSVDTSRYYELVEAFLSRLEDISDPSLEEWTLVNLVMDSALFWSDTLSGAAPDSPPNYGGTAEQWEDLSIRASYLCRRWEGEVY